MQTKGKKKWEKKRRETKTVVFVLAYLWLKEEYYIEK